MFHSRIMVKGNTSWTHETYFLSPRLPKWLFTWLFLISTQTSHHPHPCSWPLSSGNRSVPVTSTGLLCPTRVPRADSVVNYNGPVPDSWFKLSRLDGHPGLRASSEVIIHFPICYLVILGQLLNLSVAHFLIFTMEITIQLHNIAVRIEIMHLKFVAQYLVHGESINIGEKAVEWELIKCLLNKWTSEATTMTEPKLNTLLYLHLSYLLFVLIWTKRKIPNNSDFST